MRAWRTRSPSSRRCRRRASARCLALQVSGTELTVIAFIGIILLIGIVKKNGIMMVDFALDAERRRRLSPQRAIHEACLERFRPILMTTLAAMLGAVPLVIAIGPGSELRRPLGITIIGGLLGVAGADALHHAGDLSAARRAAPPAGRRHAELRAARRARCRRSRRSDLTYRLSAVIAGLDPAIHGAEPRA